MPIRRASVLLGLLLICLCGTLGCTSSPEGETPSETNAVSETSQATNPSTLRILSASENKTLEPLVQRWAQQNHTTVQMDYRGSVDIMLSLQQPSTIPYNAVWPADSLWIALGDKKKQVKDEQSICWTPVVFGVKRTVAQRLGWIGKKVRVEDILQAAESGKLRFMMTSATQSNSGAVAYLGFLHAFAGSPQVLSSEALKKPRVEANVRRILNTVNRSSGSSGWLKDLFLQKYDDYDAMVNYESVVIETNQQLIRDGREPLYAVYPTDGLAIADSPLAYLDSGNDATRKTFQKLQMYLLSAPVQRDILELGRRVGPVGEIQTQVDTTVFNSEWGMRNDAFLNQIHYPRPEVIQEALDLYQTTLRKPSLTIYCLDFSRSMEGDRIERLKSAMRMVLDQERARQSLLQASAKDVTVVMTFSGTTSDAWTVQGNNPEKLRELWAKINRAELGNGTDIYSPILQALRLCKAQGSELENYFPAIILMTDGESNVGRTISDLTDFRAGDKALDPVPVFGIQFGDASKSQLSEITDLTAGRVFDGRKDLTSAFREAKGYN